MGPAGGRSARLAWIRQTVKFDPSSAARRTAALRQSILRSTNSKELESLFARKKEADTIGINIDDPEAFLKDVRNRLAC